MKKIDSSHWYFVETPLQLINAFEAVNYFSPDSYKNTFLIRKSANKRVNNQLMKTLSLYDLDKIRVVYLGSVFPKIYFLSIIKIIFIIILSSGKNKFYLGEFNALWARVIPYIFLNSPFVLFDDGSATIAIHHYKYDFSKYRGSAKWKKKLKTPILRLLFGGIEKITLFTMYDLSPYPKQKYFKNSFAYLKQKISIEFSNDEVIYFIGGNWVESKEIKKEDYINLLVKIFKKYVDKKKKIVYLAHRRETLEKFKKLKAKLELKWEFVAPEVPVEIYFLQKKENPMNIVGFSSTALFTLSKMYSPKHLISFRVPENLLAKDIVDSTQIINNYYLNSGNIKFEDIDLASNL